MANNHIEAQELLKNLGNLIENASFKRNPKIRQEAVRLSKKLTTTLEEPENVAMELAFSVPSPLLLL